MTRRHVRIAALHKMKEEGRPIVMLTAYDAPSARIADEAGVDILLVGDSLGNVVLGYDDTIPVTLDDMIHHTAAVSRANPRALVVADMPFMSYKITSEQALTNAGRLIQEGGAQAVKLEGGAEVAGAVRRIVEAGVPVMGHVGLTPQSIHQLSGYRVQGRDEAAREKMIADAKALDEAGAFAIVIELAPSETARAVTEAVSRPTIGIGAGPDVDGQVLVWHDMLGLSEGPLPKFVKPFGNLREQTRSAIEDYCRETREKTYPETEHSYESG